MRTEDLEKEADLFEGEGKCYIHVEMPDLGRMTSITNGDKLARMTALYGLCIELADEMGKNPVDLWKFYIKNYRKKRRPEVEHI